LAERLSAVCPRGGIDGSQGDIIIGYLLILVVFSVVRLFFDEYLVILFLIVFLVAGEYWAGNGKNFGP
jgi:hypothetical protein